jgi:hypothetical protein
MSSSSRNVDGGGILLEAPVTIPTFPAKILPAILSIMSKCNYACICVFVYSRCIGAVTSDVPSLGGI